MNDQFLHRLREQPPLGFATALKAKLDLRSAAAATRKRLVYLMSLLLIGATALAFVSPSVRQFVRSLVSEPSNVQPSMQAQTDRPATKSPAIALRPATSVADKVEAPQQKREEQTNAMTVAPPAIETQQASEFLSSTDRPPRAALTSARTRLSDADFAALPAGALIRVDGTRATLAILKAAGEEFKTLTKEKIRVSTGRGGIGNGFLGLCSGDIDIYGASRPILKQEMKSCTKPSTQFIELPIAYEAIAVLVNANATWIGEITTAELKKMWEPASQGSVGRWNQINAAWPDQFFQLFGTAPNSALHEYFVDSIIGAPKLTRGDFIGSDVLDFVTNGVSRYSGATGFVHYTSDVVPASQVKTLKIVNAAGEAVSPSESAIVDASYNPLSRPLLIYVNAEHAKRPEVRAFVRFLLTQGAKSIRQTRGVPLPDDMYESVLAKFTGGKTGTVFDGKSAVGVQLDEALAREPVP